MMRPLALVRISGACFDEEVCCTEEQLIRILRAIEEVTAPLYWHVADLSTLEPVIRDAGLDGGHPILVGSIVDMKRLVRGSAQLLSGVFLATTVCAPDAEFAGEFRTEDEPFRDIGRALLEIRAFDTSYFEIYGTNVDVVEELGQRFRVPLIGVSE